jgi:hypothetical protein
MITFHRVLIGTAILFCVGFAAWSLTAYRAGGGTSQLIIGGAFALAAVGLVYYLKNLRRFLHL